MADPVTLNDLSWDDRQLLKEAVCDAILERTRRVVSGEGRYGTIKLGIKPSKSLSSGFILPRLNEDGDDESSDIRIASHGMDIRIRNVEGLVRVQPTFSVYVRVLPAADDLFHRAGRLIPQADFNDASRQASKAEITRRSLEEIPRDIPARERAERRAAISREVYIAMGVGVPGDAELPAGDERDVDAIGGDIPPPPILRGRLRIPDDLSRRYDIPQKWLKLAVEVPPLELALPCEPEVWSQLAEAHRAELSDAIRQTYLNWINSPTGRENAWRKRHPPSEAFWEPDAWNQFLVSARAIDPVPADLIPDFDVSVLIQPLRNPLDQDEYSVRIAIESLRESDSAKECGLFEVSIAVDLPNSALRPMRLERVKRSYHLAGFMTMPGIGVNGGVEDLGCREDRRYLCSTWMPRYVLPRIHATEFPEVPTSYELLCDKTFEVSRLASLPDAMREWLSNVRGSTVLTADDEGESIEDEEKQKLQFDTDVLAWDAERARIKRGIDILVKAQEAWRESETSSAAIPYRAWILLNQTFSAANPTRQGERAPGWRLFQLAFILTHVPTFASKLPEYLSEFDAAFDEDSVSLLYMSTGGGKTEAFFGTIVFALFLDRLRGKLRGVTAMMHYPLRLLTVQQAQRLARLLARAEMVRRNDSIPGSAFEIGFWVGGTNTPNSTEKRAGGVDDRLACIPKWNDVRARDEAAIHSSGDKVDREYVTANGAWNKLPTCPFCGSDAGTGLRLYPEHHHRLGIVCLNEGCEWNRTHVGGRPEPLPFLLADTDIYRRAPSILLGTIDKLALLGQSATTIDRIAGMFGLARWIEGGPDGLIDMPTGEQISANLPDGFECVAPAYAGGIELFFDPFPSLIVQDEMHLLEESLGTFGGIFETGLFAWFERLAALLQNRVTRTPSGQKRPRLPHVIGATATAADVAKHTQALYQRSVVQFPHPGPALHGGFYTRMAKFSAGSEAEISRREVMATPRGREEAAPWARLYAAIMTNGRLHTVTTLSVLAAHAATITRWQRDLSSPDVNKNSAAIAEIEDCISKARWSEQRRALVREAGNSGRFDRIAALVDLHRIQLTYVTNKKGGDQILSALANEVQEIHAEMGSEYELTSFDMELISGGVDIAGIQNVIRSAERPFDPLRDDISRSLRGIVATSAISHGVDVETFNSMAFAGMPADIAEYIQASSRVGRTHVGFSLLIPTPQTRRDRFVVEVHESFHRLLERMISPPAIERWADRAIERTIPSLVQMWAAGIRHQEVFVSLPDNNKGQASLPSSVEALDRLLRNDELFQDCAAFVKAAIGVEAKSGGATNPDYYEELIRAAVERIQVSVGSGDFTGRLGDFWSNPLSNMQRPMTSLRDVDAAGQIQASARTQRNQRLTWEEVGAAMAIIRNRGASRRRRSANSELDQEN